MPPLNLAEHEQHLRNMAMEFNSLRTRLRELADGISRMPVPL